MHHICLTSETPAWNVVSLADMQESYEVHVVRRRSLLSSALSNVADVTVEMQADSNALATQALGELDESIVNGTLAVSWFLIGCAALSCTEA